MSYVSNEEYLERWENSAPTPIQTEMTPEEIRDSQGTRLNVDAPWETYDKEFELNDAALEEAISEYAKNVSDKEATSQTKEELARLREQTDSDIREYQWVRPEEYKNVADRIGRIMHSAVFISKLRGAGVKCWYNDHPAKDKITLIVQRGELPPEVGCWVQRGFAPELSIMNFDEHGVPLAEKYRGWRTPLLQLILKGVITQRKAEEVFGIAPTTPAFHRYNSTLQNFRNAGNRLEE